MNKVDTIPYIVFHILINYYEFTCCFVNSVDPDLKKPADLDLHCFQES